MVDLDASHGDPPPDLADAGIKHGRDMLALLASNAGADDPAETYTVVTPHGEHRYFTAPEPAPQPGPGPGRGLGNSVGRLGWSIDTRGKGGYVLAAGSHRPDVKGTGRYMVTIPGPAIPLPAWMAAALAGPAHIAAAAASPAPTPALVSGRRVAAYVEAAVAGEVQNVQAAKPGTRNHTVYVAAARLGGLVAAGVLDQTRASTTLLAAAAGHVGVEDFTAAEARRTIDNGLRRGLQEPRQLT